MKRALAIFLLASSVLGVSSALGQSQPCQDVADDPHYSVVFESNRVRILTLEVRRGETTKAVCNKAPFLSIVTSASKTVTTVIGQAGIRHEWIPGEGRFSYKPTERAVRNDAAEAHRRVEIETFLPIPYDPVATNYDIDFFAGDLSSVKATASTSSSRGALTATRIQLAAGDQWALTGADHALIALSDLALKSDSGEELTLQQHDVQVLQGGKIKAITNSGRQPVRFVVVDF